MNNKELFYKALAENNGTMNEIELGECLGFNAEETAKILSQLLMDHKIEYARFLACNYSIIRKNSKKLNQ